MRYLTAYTSKRILYGDGKRILTPVSCLRSKRPWTLDDAAIYCFDFLFLTYILYHIFFKKSNFFFYRELLCFLFSMSGLPTTKPHILGIGIAPRFPAGGSLLSKSMLYDPIGASGGTRTHRTVVLSHVPIPNSVTKANCKNGKIL